MARKSTSEEKQRMIHVRLPEALHKRLRILVAKLDTSMQDWVSATVEKAVEKQEREKAEQDYDKN